MDDDRSKANKKDLNNNQTDKNSKNQSESKLSVKNDPKNQENQPPNILDYSLVGDRAVIFSLDNQVGGLVRALRIFQVIFF